MFPKRKHFRSHLVTKWNPGTMENILHLVLAHKRWSQFWLDGHLFSLACCCAILILNILITSLPLKVTSSSDNIISHKIWKQKSKALGYITQRYIKLKSQIQASVPIFYTLFTQFFYYINHLFIYSVR